MATIDITGFSFSNLWIAMAFVIIQFFYKDKVLLTKRQVK
jgi:hypothetical protein